ncbi:MAG: biotin/lipoyl-binding protein [Candidatus Limnocylindrales bacterium]|jgi:biotin carboxyl carrier protein|nr:biotin/lipoyl-binding protein [Candidatus Limnocylindrales bacterium]
MIAGPSGEAGAPAGRDDPRALRIGVAPVTRLDGDPSLSLAPAPDPATRLPQDGVAGPGLPLVDGAPTNVRLERFGEVRARLVEIVGDGSTGPAARTDLLLGPVRIDRAHGTRVREVVVGGWRIEVEVELERRAVLRERARRGAGAVVLGGPVEVRAIIPGRVVAISVAAGDAVEAGQQILVVEAMKMQNELRAPREGAVERIGVAVGDTIEVGDLLVVIH